MRIFTLSLFLIPFLSLAQQTLPDPLEAGWKGQKVCEVLLDNASVRMLKCTFPPSVGHEKHFHKKHVGYALRGGIFQINDEEGIREVQIPSGYTFYNESVVWHEVLNIGTDTAIFLIVEPK